MLATLAPPTLDYVTFEDLQSLYRANNGVLCLRIFHPQGDCIKEVPVSLANRVSFA